MRRYEVPPTPCGCRPASVGTATVAKRSVITEAASSVSAATCETMVGPGPGALEFPRFRGHPGWREDARGVVS